MSWLKEGHMKDLITCLSVTMYLLWFTLANGIFSWAGVNEGTVKTLTYEQRGLEPTKIFTHLPQCPLLGSCH